MNPDDEGKSQKSESTAGPVIHVLCGERSRSGSICARPSGHDGWHNEMSTTNNGWPSNEEEGV